MRNVASLAILNTILGWFLIVAYFFGPPCISLKAHYNRTNLNLHLAFSRGFLKIVWLMGTSGPYKGMAVESHKGYYEVFGMHCHLYIVQFTSVAHILHVTNIKLLTANTSSRPSRVFNVIGFYVRMLRRLSVQNFFVPARFFHYISEQI